MDYLWLLIFVGAIIVVMISVNIYHKGLIENKVDRLKGTMISCTRRWGVIGVGPFDLVEKHQTVFHFEYSVDGETKEGWVCFNWFDKDEWRL